MEKLNFNIFAIITSYLSQYDMMMLRYMSKKIKKLVEMSIHYDDRVYKCNNKMSNEYAYLLRNARKIDVHMCRQMTDTGIQYFKEVQIINLKGCNLITDITLK